MAKMPEGPAILVLRDQLMPFKGKVVKRAGGYEKIPTRKLTGKKLMEICTWGKHLLLVFSTATVRIHLMLFGRLLINERSGGKRSFFLEFANGEINGYTVRAKLLDGKPKAFYDWRTDIMHPDFDATWVKGLLQQYPDTTIAEAMMDQDIFTGVGNKIRNEALYAASIHPLSRVGSIPPAAISRLIKATRNVARKFYNNLSGTGANEKFAVYKKAFAPDGSEVTTEKIRKTNRKIYYSVHKQALYR